MIWRSAIGRSCVTSMNTITPDAFHDRFQNHLTKMRGSNNARSLLPNY